MKQAVLFVGHGSPLSAIAPSRWAKSLSRLSTRLTKPRAILMISAHWETHGLRVTADEKPKTIHDFTGFPRELYEVNYPAPGDSVLVQRLQELTGASPDKSWGLDHGAWSILLHLFPKADIPVVQLSLDQMLTVQEHWRLGEKIAALRKEDVLIIGSGNVVHNLREMRVGLEAVPPRWATDFDAGVANALIHHQKPTLLLQTADLRSSAEMAIQGMEHYLPLIYCAAAAGAQDPEFFYEAFEYRSLSMRSVIWPGTSDQKT